MTQRHGRPWLTNMGHVVPGTPPQVVTYDWTFDRAGRITQEVSSTDGTAVYGQDETDQLTSATYTYLPNQTFGYNANGNRDEGGFTVEETGNNRMETGAGFHYEYDNEGNRTRRYVDANANGLLDTGDGDITVYGWDYRNRLVSVTDYENFAQYFNGQAEQVVNYTYDVYNRLIGRALDPDGVGVLGWQNSYYVYDGEQILLEFDGPTAADLDHRYLWGPAVDQILADETVGSLQTPGTVLWPLTDHLGTVRDLVDYNSGEPEVVCHRVFDAFGSEIGPDVDFLFGFTGRMFDTATDLQNNLNRWYDATVGRWLSEDPIGFDAGDANLSRYVGNEPTNRTDPRGLVPPLVVVGAGAGAGAAAGAGAGAGGTLAGIGAAAVPPVTVVVCGTAASVACYKYVAPCTTMPLADLGVTGWYHLWYGDPSEALPGSLEREIEDLEDEIHDLEVEIEQKQRSKFGYGPHDVSGSLQYLAELMRRLAALKARQVQGR